MADFALSNLALKAVCPTNDILLDTAANGAQLPGVYVQVGAMTMADLLADGDGSVHPAFLVGGIQRKIWIGKFECVTHNDRAYSLPGEDPRVNITFDAALQYCRNKGNGHHLITCAEWAYLALLAKRRGTMPKGNNDYGKDSSESLYLAVPSYKDGDGRTLRTATGTGPLTWSDTGDATGIMDLNGNVWEWCAGLRLAQGELQVIPYNNAADPTVDMSATSAAWKAVRATATSYNDLYITPNGAGTTSGSVKLDYVSDHWQWAASATSTEDGIRSAKFALTTASGLSDLCKTYLQAMALLPEDNDTDYGDDNFWANNGAEERMPIRGGDRKNGVGAGAFALYLCHPRSRNADNVGLRAAFADL